LFSKKIFIQISEKKGEKTLREKALFPEVVKEMKKRNESQSDLAKILDLDVSQVCRKLKGEVAWTFGDAMIMTKHYRRGLWSLFRKNEECDKDEEKNI
jgi:hypothetical protein